MNIVTEINAWQELRRNLQNKTLGFVPTMGHLHAGHLSLCERARNENDVTVVSIFVNPTQFNQTSDFEHYPRTIESDIALLEANAIDYLFLPHAEEIYSDSYQFHITETALSTELEGEYRPGHFTGMLTVVLKLLNLMQANKAYFGEKDFQQLLLIQKMVKAFFLATDIIACPTLRAEDGLALSSRNSRLTPQQRKMAAYFPHLLKQLTSVNEIAEKLVKLGFKVDYIADKWQRRLGAVWIDDVRLIDNYPL